MTECILLVFLMLSVYIYSQIRVYSISGSKKGMICNYRGFFFYFDRKLKRRIYQKRNKICLFCTANKLAHMRFIFDQIPLYPTVILATIRSNALQVIEEDQYRSLL